MTASSTCPVCGRAVDALRARAVGVKDGKIVAYCSSECQAKAEGKPRIVDDRDLDVRVTVRTPSTPSTGVPTAVPTASDSYPVIEVIREASKPAEQAAPEPDGKDAKASKDTAKASQGAKDAKDAKATPEPKPNTPPAGTPVTAGEGKASKSGPVKARAASEPTLASQVRPLPVPDVAKGSIPLEVAKTPSKASTTAPRVSTAPTAPRDPTPVPAKQKRLDTDTRSMQPPEDYDDSDLGPPNDEPAKTSRPPILWILVFIVIAAVAAAVALKLN